MKILLDIDNQDRVKLIKFLMNQRITHNNDEVLHTLLGFLLIELGYSWCDDDIKINNP